MTIQELLAQGGDVAASARKFVEATAAFVGELSKHNLSLELGEANTTENYIDYSAPTIDSYKKTYKPITATEIIEANKKMSEAISGERFLDGMIAAIQLMLLFKP